MFQKGFFLAALVMIAAFTKEVAAQAGKPVSGAIIIKNLVDSQQYVFYAQYVNPMSGRQRFLTTEYTVRVTKDTISCDLPYFGRAYSAPINPGDGGGIRFTSTKFEYKVTPRKKAGWDITIIPTDNREVQRMVINIFDNGKANLQVTNTNRQPISFNGYVRDIKPR